MNEGDSCTSSCSIGSTCVHSFHPMHCTTFLKLCIPHNITASILLFKESSFYKDIIVMVCFSAWSPRLSISADTHINLCAPMRGDCFAVWNECMIMNLLSAKKQMCDVQFCLISKIPPPKTMCIKGMSMLTWCVPASWCNIQYSCWIFYHHKQLFCSHSVLYYW